MNVITSLKPGDKVKIVDAWANDGACSENDEGKMDRFLGKVVTVREVHHDFAGTYFYICEDAGTGGVNPEGGWYWNASCVDCIVDEREYELASEEELMSLILS